MKISKLSAPTEVVIDENNQEPIVLDCEYDISQNEKGFVLKWLLDGSTIYQWIPGRAPFALVRILILFIFLKYPKLWFKNVNKFPITEIFQRSC